MGLCVEPVESEGGRLYHMGKGELHMGFYWPPRTGYTEGGGGGGELELYVWAGLDNCEFLIAGEFVGTCGKEEEEVGGVLVVGWEGLWYGP